MPQVLIIDGDPYHRMLVTDVLESEGYVVRTAADGTSGLFEYATLRPDCVVLDVLLPGLDGFEVLRRIRATDDEPVPVIMLTAVVAAESATHAWQVGVDYFLGKPFEPHELLDLLGALLTEGLAHPAADPRTPRPTGSPLRCTTQPLR